MNFRAAFFVYRGLVAKERAGSAIKRNADEAVLLIKNSY